MNINIKDKEFFYQEVAEPIVNKILSLMKEGVKDFESYASWIYTNPISSEEENFSHFNWRMKIVRSDSKDFNYSFFGLAGRDYCDEPSISITIVLPKGKHQKSIKLRRPELYDVVSHELHHLAQNMESNHYARDWEESNASLAYLLDPYEIEAFHIGIRAQSALSGRCFDDIAKGYIRSIGYKVTEEQIDMIVSKWKNTDFPAFKLNAG